MKPRWRWIELFAAMQILWGALLFLPGAQPYRMFIRGAPFIASLATLVYFLHRASGVPLAASSKWLLGVMAVFAANLLHPDTYLAAGVAQVIFQLSIAAPMFWAAWTVRDTAQLARLLRIVFFASLASATLGVLQVYYPEQFLPPEFSSLFTRLNPAILDALSYAGPDGRAIIRPPGLSDVPGGAAVAGLISVLLGIVYLTQEDGRRLQRLVGAAAAGIGMTVLYLTQVRSLTVMAVFGVLTFAAIRLRQGRILGSAWIAAGGSALAAAAFLWATTIGGQAVEARFSGLFETGLLDSFHESRGGFLEQTIRELLFVYPLGAGLGRWGMMQVYFPDPSMWQAPPIYVEIQLTGWLLDGGVPMWIGYGGALAAALVLAYVTAVHRRGAHRRLLAAAVLAFQASLLGLCMTGPVFNSQIGLLFWLVTGALYGVSRTAADHEAGAVEES